MERRASTAWYAPGVESLAIPACFGYFALDDPACGTPAPGACLYRRRCIRYLVSCGVRGVDPAVELPLIGRKMAWRLAKMADHDRIDPTPYIDPAVLRLPLASLWSRWRGALLDVLPPTVVLVRYPHHLDGEAWWREPTPEDLELGVGPAANVWCRLRASTRRGGLRSVMVRVECNAALAAYPRAQGLARAVRRARQPDWTRWIDVPRLRVEDAGRLAGRLLVDGLVKDTLLTPGGRVRYRAA